MKRKKDSRRQRQREWTKETRKKDSGNKTGEWTKERERTTVEAKDRENGQR